MSAVAALALLALALLWLWARREEVGPAQRRPCNSATGPWPGGATTKYDAITIIHDSTAAPESGAAKAQTQAPRGREFRWPRVNLENDCCDVTVARSMVALRGPAGRVGGNLDPEQLSEAERERAWSEVMRRIEALLPMRMYGEVRLVVHHGHVTRYYVTVTRQLDQRDN